MVYSSKPGLVRVLGARWCLALDVAVGHLTSLNLKRPETRPLKKDRAVGNVPAADLTDLT